MTATVFKVGLAVAAAVSIVVPARSVAATTIAFRSLQMIDATHGYALSAQNPDAYRLLWTTDGGRRWMDVTPGNGRIHPSGPLSILGQTRLFSTKLRQGVFAVERSDNGGKTWRRSLPFRDVRGQGAGQPFALDAHHLYLAVDEGAAAGSQGEALYTSADGGKRWRFRSRTDVTGRHARTLPFGCDKSGFGFSTPARGWAGGYCPGGFPFFYRTDDGGRTWRRQPLPVPSDCACETSAPLFFTRTSAGLSVSGFRSNGGGKPFARVLWTTDGGKRWRASAPTTGRVADVSFAGARTVWITAQKPGSLRAPFDRLVRTDDAGLRWRTIKLPFDASNYRLDVVSKSVAFAFRVAVSSSVLVFTRDGGRTWKPIHVVVSSPVPRWLRAAEQRTLANAFGGAKPAHVVYLTYPHKIAVVFEFGRVVICGSCSAPSNAALPRGRVIRLSYDRTTHRVRAADGLRFCEARGSRPPLRNCLQR